MAKIDQKISYAGQLKLDKLVPQNKVRQIISVLSCMPTTLVATNLPEHDMVRPDDSRISVSSTWSIFSKISHMFSFAS